MILTECQILSAQDPEKSYLSQFKSLVVVVATSNVVKSIKSKRRRLDRVEIQREFQRSALTE